MSFRSGTTENGDRDYAVSIRRVTSTSSPETMSPVGDGRQSGRATAVGAISLIEAPENRHHVHYALCHRPNIWRTRANGARKVDPLVQVAAIKNAAGRS